MNTKRTSIVKPPALHFFTLAENTYNIYSKLNATKNNQHVTKMASEHLSNVGDSHNLPPTQMTTASALMPTHASVPLGDATPHPPGALVTDAVTPIQVIEPGPTESVNAQTGGPIKQSEAALQPPETEDDTESDGEILSFAEQVDILFLNAKVKSLRKKYILSYSEELVDKYFAHLIPPPPPNNREYEAAIIDTIGKVLAAYTLLQDSKRSLRASTPMGNLPDAVEWVFTPFRDRSDVGSMSGITPEMIHGTQPMITAPSSIQGGDKLTTVAEEVEDSTPYRRNLLDTSEIPRTITKRSRIWKSRIVYQRMRLEDLRDNNLLYFEDQGVIFEGHRAYDVDPLPGDINDDTHLLAPTAQRNGLDRNLATGPAEGSKRKVTYDFLDSDSKLESNPNGRRFFPQDKGKEPERGPRYASTTRPDAATPRPSGSGIAKAPSPVDLRIPAPTNTGPPPGMKASLSTVGRAGVFDTPNRDYRYDNDG